MNFLISSALALLALITLLDPKAKATKTHKTDPKDAKDAVATGWDDVVEGAADSTDAAAAAASATAAVAQSQEPRNIDLMLTDLVGLEAENSPSIYARRFPSRRSRRSPTASASVAGISERTSYHSNAELEESMRALTLIYPNMTHLYSIGKSVKGIKMFVLAIAGKKPESHVTLRPEMKYVGNMHGNEVVGREIIIRYAKYLLQNYASSSRVRHLLDNSRIHLMPTMNPDGFAKAIFGCTGVTGRTNSMGYDLNRNFPDYFDPSHNPLRQAEAQNVMDWATNTQFVISANMHGGAVVANYPFDNNKGGTTMYSSSPDDDVFRSLASSYAAHNPPMLTSKEFSGGITNGAAWYPLPGGMQDWMYLRAGCMELTLEISECKYPAFQFIEGFWRDNQDSMTALLYKGFVGVKGVVKAVVNTSDVDESPEPLVGVEVSVVGRPEVKMKTTSEGEFWRLLMPGKHVLRVEAECCWTELVNVTVEPTNDADDFDPSPAVDNLPLEIIMKYRESMRPSPETKTTSKNEDVHSSTTHYIHEDSSIPASTKYPRVEVEEELTTYSHHAASDAAEELELTTFTDPGYQMDESNSAAFSGKLNAKMNILNLVNLVFLALILDLIIRR